MYIAIQITSVDLVCASTLMSCTGTAVVRMPHSLTAALVCQRLISAPLSSRTLVHNTFNKMLTAEGEKILELPSWISIHFSLGQIPIHFKRNAILSEITASIDIGFRGSKCHNSMSACKDTESLACEIHSGTKLKQFQAKVMV